MCSCFVIPFSGRMMKEMLGCEGKRGIETGGPVWRAMSWSSITGSAELCVEFRGRGDDECPGNDEVSLVGICSRGVEPLFQLAMEKG